MLWCNCVKCGGTDKLADCENDRVNMEFESFDHLERKQNIQMLLASVIVLLLVTIGFAIS